MMNIQIDTSTESIAILIQDPFNVADFIFLRLVVKMNRRDSAVVAAELRAELRARNDRMEEVFKAYVATLSQGRPQAPQESPVPSQSLAHEADAGKEDEADEASRKRAKLDRRQGEIDELQAQIVILEDEKSWAEEIQSLLKASHTRWQVLSGQGSSSIEELQARIVMLKEEKTLATELLTLGKASDRRWKVLRGKGSSSSEDSSSEDSDH